MGIDRSYPLKHIYIEQACDLLCSIEDTLESYTCSSIARFKTVICKVIITPDV